MNVMAKSNVVSFCTCFAIYARCCDSSFTTELMMAIHLRVPSTSCEVTTTTGLHLCISPTSNSLLSIDRSCFNLNSGIKEGSQSGKLRHQASNPSPFNKGLAETSMIYNISNSYQCVSTLLVAILHMILLYSSSWEPSKIKWESGQYWRV